MLRIKQHVSQILLAALTIVLLASCATMFTKGGGEYRAAKREYEKQNYYAAVEGSLEALALNPEFPEAIELFQKAFNEGNDTFLATVNAGKDPENFQGTINAYAALKALVALNTLAADSGRRDVTTKDYTGDLEPARQFMLKSNYDMGLKLLASDSKKDIRTSAAFFRFVLNEEAGYAEAEAKLAEAKEAGIVDVAFSLTDESFMSYVLYAFSENEWVRVAAPEDYPGYNLVGPFDQMMNDLQTGKLDYVVWAELDIDYGSSKDKSFGETVVEGENFISSGPTTINTHHHTYSWTRDAVLNYKVYEAGMGIIKEGTIENNGGDSFTYYVLPNNDIEDVNFDGVKYHLSISNLPMGYDQTDIGALVGNINGLFHIVLSAEEMTNKSAWLNYYRNEYLTFSDFQYLKEDFEGQVFSDPSTFRFRLEDGTEDGFAPIFRTSADVDRFNYSSQMADISSIAAASLGQFLGEYLSEENLRGADYTDAGSDLTESLCLEVGSVF